MIFLGHTTGKSRQVKTLKEYVTDTCLLKEEIGIIFSFFCPIDSLSVTNL